MEEDLESREEPKSDAEMTTEVKPTPIAESSGEGPSNIEDRPSDQDIVEQHNQLRYPASYLPFNLLLVPNK